ncbi:UNVERIFIED_ORG: alkylhydroperoxidase family enzyme [Martelella mediterranea]
MPFFKSLPKNAGPPNVFKQYPDIYGPWSETSEAMMNGPSPLSQGERELLQAYAAGISGCAFVYTGHSEVAYAWGIARGTLEKLMADIETAPVDDRLKPIFAYVRKLVTAPRDLTQADADAVFDAGWAEKALHDAVVITARVAFMQRLVDGFGFAPLDPAVAASHAKKRVERGYVNVYSTFRKQK